MSSPLVTKLILYISAVWLLSAFVGALVYGIFFHREGPIYDYPMAIGLLLCAILIACTIQTFVLYPHLRKLSTSDAPKPKWFLTSNLIYFAFLTAISLFFFIGTCIGQPWMPIDGIVWSLVLIIVNATNTYILWVLKRKSISPETGSEMKLHEKGKTTENAEDASDGSARVAIRCLKMTGIVLNVILKGCVLLYFGLMLGGCWIQGLGYADHGSSPPGTFLTVSHSLGTQRFHLWCDGPTDDTRPVVWIETGGGHSMYDLLGLHQGLVSGGYRACVYDKPGMGLSDYRFPGESYGTYYEELLQAAGVKGPFVLAGWGGGGEAAWEYARVYPHNVTAVILMDYYDDNFEFDSNQYVYNLTDKEVAEQKTAAYHSRAFLHDIIRLLGVQWGFMSFIAAPARDTFIPAEYYDAYAFFNVYNEKSWTTQYFGLHDMFFNEPYPFENNTINRDIPLQVMASWTNGTAQCIRQNQPLDSQECKHTIKRAEYSNQYKLNITTFTDHSELATCMDCGLGFPVDKPEWTIETLLEYLDKLPKIQSI